MDILDEHVEGLLEKYIKNDQIVSFGTGPINEKFVRKLALYIEHQDLNIKIIPTSHKMSSLCSELKLKTTTLDEDEVDLAFDFVDEVDEDFNYISNETTSLVRDKMIAKEASEFIVTVHEDNFVKKLQNKILLEVSPFSVNKTLLGIMNLGEASIVEIDGEAKLSETGNHFIEVEIDDIYDLDDIEYQAKQIPGVIETSLFIGFADRVLLYGSTLKMKSRMLQV
jgi:ribose 5-phosphate isomerase A